MKPSSLKQIALIVAIALGSAAGGYWLRPPSQVAATQAVPAAGAKAARKVLYWYDPMVPAQHFDKPGKSPFMDMQLVAKYADEGGEAAGVKIDAGVVQNLGIRLAVVERSSLVAPLEAAASIGFDERQLAIVQARVNGFVQKVYALAPGDIIAAGAPLADLLAPDWAGAQQEFLALRASGDTELLRAARERLRLLGMPDSLITQVERSGRPQAVITVYAPIAGVIQELDVRAGMTVSAGMTLAKVNGLGTVWLEAAIPEAQAGQVQVGQSLQAHLAAYPGETFSGTVIAILPQTNADSRTLRVRVALPNRQGRLKPGMFANVRLEAGSTQRVLQIPSEAVIRTGTRTLALLASGGGHFQPVAVQIGREAGGKSEVLKGLTAGQQVVASGQFLIDSEANLKGVLARLEGNATVSAPAVASAQAAGSLNQASGKVESLEAGQITLSHGPVATLGWGAMTMSFKLAKPELVAGIKVGDSVTFGFSQQGGDFVVQQLSKAGSKP